MKYIVIFDFETEYENNYVIDVDSPEEAEEAIFELLEYDTLLADGLANLFDDEVPDEAFPHRLYAIGDEIQIPQLMEKLKYRQSQEYKAFLEKQKEQQEAQEREQLKRLLEKYGPPEENE